MHESILRTPTPFRFRDVVFSHGWLRLAPFEWQEETGTLSRVEQLASGRLALLELSEAPEGVRLRIDALELVLPLLAERARWLLALDEDLRGFHTLCQGDAGLVAAGQWGMGRILRSSTVWEDLVKTLFSVNTTWGQTVSMTRNLVNHYGEPFDAVRYSFPSPEIVAVADPAELQQVCRVGYRAESLVGIAREIGSGRIDLEALKSPDLPAEEVEARLRSLRGIGPYAAANMLMLLGRYDHLPVDSWFRKTVRDAWFGGREASDRELVARFDRFRPYRTLVYRFYDWQGALRTSVWTENSDR